MVIQVLYNFSDRPNVSGLPNTFNDVGAGLWYTDAVTWGRANSVVSGLGDGIFAPNENITRQDLAVILDNFATQIGAELPTTRASSSFGDQTNIATYATSAVDRFYRAGIVSGMPDGSFNPRGTATRAELATMLHRFLEAAGL